MAAKVANNRVAPVLAAKTLFNPNWKGGFFMPSGYRFLGFGKRRFSRGGAKQATQAAGEAGLAALEIN